MCIFFTTHESSLSLSKNYLSPEQYFFACVQQKLCKRLQRSCSSSSSSSSSTSIGNNFKLFGANRVKRLVLHINSQPDIRRLRVLEYGTVDIFRSYAAAISSFIDENPHCFSQLKYVIFPSPDCMDLFILDDARNYSALCYKVHRSLKYICITHALQGFPISSNSTVQNRSQILCVTLVILPTW